MSIDDHELEPHESQSSLYNEDRPRNDSLQYSRTPSRGSTVRWPQGIDEKKLLRKIDWSIIPVLMAAYFLQFLDKVVYNVSHSYMLSYLSLMSYAIVRKCHGNAKRHQDARQSILMGSHSVFPRIHNRRVTTGSNLSPFSYQLILIIIPGILIQRLPVTKVLSGNILCWGIVLCGTAAVKTPTQMIAARALLGGFESVITPALIMITSAWYKRNESAPRFGLWYSGMGFGQIIGGAISYGAQHHEGSLAGWRIMFLCIGIVNCFIASAVWWLPCTPEDARFLTSAEKEAIAQRLHDDHAGVGVKKLRVRSIFETFLDLQTWLLCLLTILIVIPSGVISTYSSILIKGFGYNSKQAALLNMPSGVVSILALATSTWVVRKGYQRWIAIVMAIIPTLIGACLMSFLPKSNKAGLLTGIYLVNFVSARSFP